LLVEVRATVRKNDYKIGKPISIVNGYKAREDRDWDLC